MPVCESAGNRTRQMGRDFGRRENETVRVGPSQTGGCHRMLGMDRGRESGVGLHPFVEHYPRSFGSRTRVVKKLERLEIAQLRILHRLPFRIGLLRLRNSAYNLAFHEVI